MITFSQCDVDVDAGMDFSICPGDVVLLNGNVSGSFSDFFWEPEARVLDPNSLFTEAVGPGTYTLIAQANSGDNLIVNGGFAQGNSGFTSDYTYFPLGPYAGHASYSVGNNPMAMNGSWVNCNDVNGDGNMLIADGADQAGQNVWCQTVAVNPNTEYTFIFYFKLTRI